MGTRTVTTVFAVSGEKDYRQAVQNINRDIKVLDSALKLNAEKFKGQDEALAKLSEKTDILEDKYKKQSEKVGMIEEAWKNCRETAEKYEEQIDQIKKAIELTKREMDRLSGDGQKDSDAFSKLKKNLGELEKELDNKQGMYDAAIRGAKNWEISLNDARTALYTLNDEMDENTSELEAVAIQRFQDTEDAIEDVTEEAGTMEEEVPSSIEVVAQAIAAAGLTEAFNKIRDAMGECIEKSKSFETDVAGVFKTVNGMTADEEEAMADAIKEMSTRIPATTTEISAVAEAAGQLGIAKDDILAFSEVMLKLGTTTNVSAEDAAISLARLANIADVESKDFERLGSVVVELGNNNATFEDSIIELTTRMATAGDIVGMSAVDMMAYATALNSAGIQAEEGGTAIGILFKNVEQATALYDVARESVEKTGYTVRELELMEANESKAFKQIADDIGLTSDELNSYIKNIGDLEKYASTAGMDAVSFIEGWEIDPADTLNQFLKGLGEMDKKGGNSIVLLNDMGLTAERLSKAIQTLASDNERLDKIFSQARRAWKENTALEEEAARRYETLESKTTMLGNAISNFEIAIGDDFNNTMEPTVENLIKFFNASTDLAEESPAISTGLATIGGGLGTLTTLTTGAAVISGITKALSMFGPNAAGIALGAFAVGGLAAAVINLVNNSEGVSASAQEVLDANDAILKKTESSKSIYEENMAAAELNEEKVNSLIEKLWAFHDEDTKTPATEAIIKDSINRLNELLPGLGAKYDEVTRKINMTRTAMEMFAQAAAEQRMLEVLQGYLDELSGEGGVLEIRQRANQYELAESTEEYEAALNAFNKYENSMNTWEYWNRRSDPKWRELKDALELAKNEVNELKADDKALTDALNENRKDIEYTTRAYEDMADAIEESARKVEQMVTYAEAADTAVKNMQHHSLASFGDTSAAEQQLYRAMADTVGGNGAGFVISGGGSTVNNYNVTVDAKNIRELNDIVRIAEQEKQTIRMGFQIK